MTRSDPPSRQRILIVDDNLDTAVAMSRLLELLGYEAHTAESFQQALELCRQSDFDLLITDIALADGNGLDLLPQLRKAGCANLKGITVSGFDEIEDLKRSKEAGFEAHFTKPVRFAEMQSLVARLLS